MGCIEGMVRGMGGGSTRAQSGGVSQAAMVGGRLTDLPVDVTSISSRCRLPPGWHSPKSKVVRVSAYRLLLYVNNSGVDINPAETKPANLSRCQYSKTRRTTTKTQFAPLKRWGVD